MRQRRTARFEVRSPVVPFLVLYSRGRPLRELDFAVGISVVLTGIAMGAMTLGTGFARCGQSGA